MPHLATRSIVSCSAGIFRSAGRGARDRMSRIDADPVADVAGLRLALHGGQRIALERGELRGRATSTAPAGRLRTGSPFRASSSTVIAPRGDPSASLQRRSGPCGATFSNDPPRAIQSRPEYST